MCVCVPLLHQQHGGQSGAVNGLTSRPLLHPRPGARLREEIPGTVPVGRGPALTASPVQPPAAGHAPLSRDDAAAFPGLGTGFAGRHEAGGRV